ncbi:MAG: VTT domain-containing protein [Patescibacteria group bacterium]
MTKRQAIIKAVSLIAIILIISGILFHLQKLIGLETLKSFILQSGPLGPIVYILLIVLSHIFAPIQGSPVYFLGFAVFGKWTLIYTYVAHLISSFTNFWIARKLGRGIVVKLAGNEGMNKIDRLAQNDGVKILIILRLFQGFISDFVSYAAGLTAIKFSTYYIISALATIPGMLITWVLLDQLPPDQAFFWALAIGGLLFIIPSVYYLLKKKLN